MKYGSTKYIEQGKTIWKLYSKCEGERDYMIL